MTKRILITGAAGYIGSILRKELQGKHEVLGLDIRSDASTTPPVQIGDIRDPKLRDIMAEHRISHVVHLASVLESSGNPARDYDIDVNGTRNVVESCLAAGVQHLCVTSSGAAYGYHHDNPAWIREDTPVRGNDEFPYAKHKRLVEDMLARYRQTHPELRQLILRPGTVLGAHTENLITNLFKKRRILAIRGSETPFVFIWDQDVVRIILQGVETDAEGVYNLAGDGAVPLRDIAQMLGKSTLELPPWLLRMGLLFGSTVRLTRYGPEQLKFLQYRPVLDNHALKTTFGYTPQMTSKETFLFWMKHAKERGSL